jgi:hypothetical protein
MDYGNLFTRAWDTLWKNAFMILLGALAVIENVYSSSTSQSRYVFLGGEFPWQELQRFDFIRPFSHGDFSALEIGGIFLLVIALVLFGLVLWVLELIARGGMISAVDDLESGKPTSFVTALKAGWEKAWRLLGIGLVPAIPGLILLIIVVSNLVFSGFRLYSGVDMGWNGLRAFAPLLFLTCLFVPIMLLFSALQAFANRACMMEDTGVIESYRRGLEVLGENLGPAVILFILQLVIVIVVGIMFVIPAILAAMCCLLLPLLILIQGAFTAFFSILWTLAWQGWVGVAEI